MRIPLKEETLDGFAISDITRKAINKKSLNEPELISALISDQDLELLFEVESTAEEHHKVDLKGNAKESARGYAVIVRFVKAKEVLYENAKVRKHLYEYTEDETLRNAVEEKIPAVLEEFGIDNEKLADKLPGCLNGKKETWEDKLTRVFKSFDILKCDDVVDALLKDSVKKEISRKNLKKNIQKVIDNCDAVVHCDCPSFYYQGMQQDDSANGNARFKFQGTGGNHVWSLMHSKANGVTGKAFCKHLEAVRDWLYNDSNLEKIIAKLDLKESLIISRNKYKKENVSMKKDIRNALKSAQKALKESQMLKETDGQDWPNPFDKSHGILLEGHNLAEGYFCEFEGTHNCKTPSGEDILIFIGRQEDDFDDEDDFYDDELDDTDYPIDNPEYDCVTFRGETVNFESTGDFCNTAIGSDWVVTMDIDSQGWNEGYLFAAIFDKSELPVDLLQTLQEDEEEKDEDDDDEPKKNKLDEAGSDEEIVVQAFIQAGADKNNSAFNTLVERYLEDAETYGWPVFNAAGDLVDSTKTRECGIDDIVRDIKYHWPDSFTEEGDDVINDLYDSLFYAKKESTKKVDKLTEKSDGKVKITDVVSAKDFDSAVEAMLIDIAGWVNGAVEDGDGAQAGLDLFLSNTEEEGLDYFSNEDDPCLSQLIASSSLIQDLTLDKLYKLCKAYNVDILEEDKDKKEESVSKRNRKGLRESVQGFVACDVVYDDDVCAAQLPAGSAYAGDWIVYSISSRGMWIANAVIVKNFDTDRLFDCNPFCDPEELKASGFDVVVKLAKAKGYSSVEPVIFDVADGERFIDFYNYGTDISTTGSYFGEAGLEEFLVRIRKGMRSF